MANITIRIVSLALVLSIILSFASCTRPAENIISSDIVTEDLQPEDIVSKDSTPKNTVFEKTFNIRFHDSPYMHDETIFYGVTAFETDNAIFYFDETVDAESAEAFSLQKSKQIDVIMNASYLPKLDGKIKIAVSKDFVTEYLNETTMVCSLDEESFNFTLTYLSVLFGEYFNYGIVYGLACEICGIELDGDLEVLENPELLDLNYFCLTNDDFYDTEPVKRYAQLFVKYLLSGSLYDPIRNKDEAELMTLYVGWLALLGIDYEYNDSGAKFSCKNLQGRGKKLETENLICEIEDEYRDSFYDDDIMREYSTLKENVIYLETVVAGLNDVMGLKRDEKTAVYWIPPRSVDLQIDWRGIEVAGAVADPTAGFFPVIRTASICHFQHEYTHILDTKSDRRWKAEMLASYFEDFDFDVEYNYADTHVNYELHHLLLLDPEASKISDELEKLDNVDDWEDLICDFLCYDSRSYISVGDEHYADDDKCTSFMNYLLTQYPEDDIIASLMLPDSETKLDKPWHLIKDDYVEYINQKFAYLE